MAAKANPRRRRAARRDAAVQGARRPKSGPAPARPARAPLRARLTPPLPELLVAVAVVAISVWAWFALVVQPGEDEQSIDGFMLTLAITQAAGVIVQVALLVWVRSPGSLRERLTLENAVDAPENGFTAMAAGVLVTAIVLLVGTPPSTDLEDFGDFPYLVAIALIVLVAVLAMLGGLLIFLLVGLPLGWLVAAVLPTRPSAPGQLHLNVWSRGMLVGGAAILLGTLGFAISMVAANPDVQGGSSRRRAARQFAAWVRGEGDPILSLLALLFLIAIVAGVVGYNRAHRAQQSVALSRWAGR